MNVKIDTKEKFTVIVPQLPHLTANMTEELGNMLLTYMQKDIPHIVLNMSLVNSLEARCFETIAAMQQKFYENNCSFVICAVQTPVEEVLDKEELLELLNVTPTESEAWDILQMEEVERELLGGDE